MSEPSPISIPIDGTLDLHTFRSDEVKVLLENYLVECRDRGILQVRIIHGKGTGALRERVHTLLACRPEVASFSLAEEHAGGWGATIIILNAAENGD